MITLMVGRADRAALSRRARRRRSRDVLLDRRRSRRQGHRQDIDFALHSGEVLGLFGLMGSGRTELARILFGLDAFDSGEIVVGDQPRRGATRRAAASASGVAFITENRREEGLLMNMRDRRQHRARGAAEVRA